MIYHSMFFKCSETDMLKALFSPFLVILFYPDCITMTHFLISIIFALSLFFPFFPHFFPFLSLLAFDTSGAYFSSMSIAGLGILICFHKMISHILYSVTFTVSAQLFLSLMDFLHFSFLLSLFQTTEGAHG